MTGISLDAEAGARAVGIDDLCDRLEASGRLFRIDPRRPATMYRATMLSADELSAVRQIEQVVRLGHVRRVEIDRIVLERGEVETGPEVLHVDCTALGLRNAPAVPIFQPDRIVLQQVRQNSPCFNAALAAFVEVHREDDVDKNRLCPPNAYATSMSDWPRMVTNTGRRTAVAARARHLPLDRGEPAQPAPWLAGSHDPRLRDDRRRAVRDARGRRDRAAEAPRGRRVRRLGLALGIGDPVSEGYSLRRDLERADLGIVSAPARLEDRHGAQEA